MTDNAQTIANLASAAAPPVPLDRGALYLISAHDGSQTVVDTRDYLNRPEFAKASRTVRDARSFLEYIEKHGTDATEVWADTETSTVTAILDAHEGAGMKASHEQHSVTLRLIHTPEWLTWIESNKVSMSQVMFANFIEENAPDIVQPTSSEMLELAQTFQANTNVDFKSATRLPTGETSLRYEEKVTARAGNGNIEIPEKIKLGLQPYVGGTRYGIDARFRYQLRGGDVSFQYLLDRPHEVLENAFADLVSVLRTGIEAETVKGVELPSAVALGVPIHYGKSK